MEVEVYRTDGSRSGEVVTLPPAIFEIEPNDQAIYQAVRIHLANRRQGTHKSKTRSEVRGGGKKPWRQKHTGRARSGSSRSPVWIGGGAIFGPQPRDYEIDIPRKVKLLARKSALSYKAKGGEILVIEDFSLEAPKTKEMASILKSLALQEKKTLLLTPKTDSNVYKSGRNLPLMKVLEARKASTYDILNNQVLMIQKSALDVLVSALRNEKN
jgi:large subunit ribosomal protein L4